jgi:hypothetical protein
MVDGQRANLLNLAVLCEILCEQRVGAVLGAVAAAPSGAVAAAPAVPGAAAPAAAAVAASGEVNVVIVEMMVVAGATSHPQIVQVAVDPSMPVPWRPLAAEMCHLVLFLFADIK